MFNAIGEQTGGRLLDLIQSSRGQSGKTIFPGAPSARHSGVVKCGDLVDETSMLYEGTASFPEMSTLTWVDLGDCFLWADGQELIPDTHYPAEMYGVHSADIGGGGSSGPTARYVWYTGVEGVVAGVEILHISGCPICDTAGAHPSGLCFYPASKYFLAPPSGSTPVQWTDGAAVWFVTAYTMAIDDTCCGCTGPTTVAVDGTGFHMGIFQGFSYGPTDDDGAGSSLPVYGSDRFSADWAVACSGGVPVGTAGG